MASQRLELRQAQSLVMTPLLQQAIRLLQMSNLDLDAFLSEELERNPLLDREQTDREAQVAPDGEAAPMTDGSMTDGDPADVGEPLPEAFDYGGYDVEEEAFGWEGSVSAGPGEEAGEGLEPQQAQRQTLRERLLDEVRLEFRDPAERLVAAYLVEALDEAGYLTLTLDEVADALGCEEALVERVLDRLQSFEPSGLFARDLAECLALQLRQRGELDEPMRLLLQHLDLAASRDFQRLARLCRTTPGEVQALLARIRRLDPKPALRLLPAAEVPSLPPDILMRADGAGGWLLELNPETLPRVLVDRAYHARLSARCRTRPAREFLAERLQSANWLVKSLDQRAVTILRVVSEIVRRQDSFFRQGIHSLRPMTLRDIAESVGLHESTVSRVTSNKVIATPRGVFDLKFFFTNAISQTDGDSLSAEAVRHRIRTLIEQERPDAVLSDDTIVDVLREQGIEIARRTVAKYRESMNILSSVQRRREKALAR